MKHRAMTRTVKIVEIPYEELVQACEIPQGYYLKSVAKSSDPMRGERGYATVELTLEKINE